MSFGLTRSIDHGSHPSIALTRPLQRPQRPGRPSSAWPAREKRQAGKELRALLVSVQGRVDLREVSGDLR